MTKLTLPGATNYAPVVGAEFPATQLGADMPDKPAWGTPEHDAWLAQIGRNAFIYGHMGPGGFDQDKQDAIDNDENYDVTPTQAGGA